MINISFKVWQHTSEIISAFESVKSPIKSLLDKGDAHVLNKINKHVGVSSILPQQLDINLGSKKYILSSDSPYVFRLSEQNIKTKEIEKDVYVKNSRLDSAKGFGNNDNAVEKFLSDVCELFDLPLLKLRKLFVNSNFEEFFKFASKNTQKVKGARLSVENWKMSNEIIDLFRKIDRNYLTVHASTRAHIKNTCPLIKQGMKGSKQIVFENLNGKEYCINVLIDRQKNVNLFVCVTDKQDNVTNIIIEPDGKVLKSKNISHKYVIGEKQEYYTQEELDAPEFVRHLSLLKTELEKYDQYVLKRIQKVKDYKKEMNTKYSTSTIGTVASEDMLTEMQENFSKIKKAILSLKDKTKKDAGKEKLHLQTVISSPNMLFKDIGENDILLGFPVIGGKPSMEIVVKDFNGQVEKNYFIQGTKLVKNTGRTKRIDTNFNYQSQNEIDRSGVKDYLEVLNKRLNRLVEIISQGAGWYR